MPAISKELSLRAEEAVHQLVRRKNFAQREPGIILVFAIVGAVAILLIGLFVHKKLSARKAARAT
ncbi:hypothetical protein M501DRAFT_993614 [Patellaria atrata CBS 101060]|uniref:Uncharacterized protein n=1 Tax=Patellaria atrata CBS 101060 TaxID=1346257 RepID=A0A9P4SIA8_9PEZI|nr:hypothetical protein M501DRAFT_993614 [Patellaria atrata CBS 101060]